ncbi:hypothetical protein ES703_103420 [subsurface metagenome]
MLVSFAVASQRLLGIVRDVEREVQKEWNVLVTFDERQRPVGNQVAEVVVTMEHLPGSFVEVVKTGAVQLIVDEVVDESVTDAEELVEALLGRPVIRMRAQMPLSEEPCTIAGCLKDLGDSDLAPEHVPSHGTIHLPLHPRVDV